MDYKSDLCVFFQNHIFCEILRFYVTSIIYKQKTLQYVYMTQHARATPQNGERGLALGSPHVISS